MVAIIGVVVCLYVVTRVLDLWQRERTTTVTRAMLFVTACAALGGLTWLVMLGSSIADRPPPTLGAPHR